MSRNKAIGFTPVDYRGRRFVLRIAAGAAVVAIAGLLVGAFFLGRATAPDALEIGGEMVIQKGVPIPSRHSIAGAATAASNFQVASVRVSGGTLNAEDAQAALLAENAGEKAKKALQAPTSPSSALSQERKSYSPSSVVVQSYNGIRAVVHVWGSLTTSSRVVPDPAGSVLWSTSFVTLEWRDERWRVVDQRSQDGPWPARSGERFATSEGEFSFRYDEVGGAWAYVPEE